MLAIRYLEGTSLRPGMGRDYSHCRGGGLPAPWPPFRRRRRRRGIMKTYTGGGRNEVPPKIIPLLEWAIGRKKMFRRFFPWLVAVIN